MQENKFKDNWFNQGGQEYAKFRPIYPSSLAAFLANLAQNNDLAIDIGCGNGQLTLLLADYFTKVIGIDPSQSQISNAPRHPKIQYICASAESLPVLSSVNLITVAQAAHWLDLPSFYSQIQKFAAKNCILALICYGKVSLDSELNPIFADFYANQLYKYWTFDRSLVDKGYAQLDLPFTELSSKPFDIRYDWTYDQFIGYISTWSAIKHVKRSGNQKLFNDFTARLAKAWGDNSTKRRISWPIHMRLANINQA